jgi:hypothetical protein
MVMRGVVRLIGATVAGLTLLSGSVGTAGLVGTAAAAPPRAAGADSTRSALPLAAGASGLELKLTKVYPAATGLDDELVVTGSVRNVGTTTVKKTVVSLWLRPEVLADREAIDTWLSDGTLTLADHQLVQATVRNLPSGATGAFKLEVPPGQTGLTSEFGPRAIALQARVGGRRMASLRTTMVWAPTEITTPTRLSVLVPITSVTPSTHAGEPTAAELATGGRLKRILDAAQDKGMAWAIDPAVLTAAQRLGTGGIDRTPDDADLTEPDASSSGSPSSSAGAAVPSTTAGGSSGAKDDAAKTAGTGWLNQFKSDSRSRGLFGLPYADPDLTAVLGSRKGVPIVKSSDALGREATKAVLGTPLDTTLAWPADGRVNAATVRNLIQLKRKTVVLAAGTQTPDPPLDYTPTGRSTVRSSAGSLSGLLYDEQLSSLISSPASRTPIATQTLLAQLAAITMEQPGTGRHLLAVTPRNWNPDPTTVHNLMYALGSAPWISLRGISKLQAASGPPRAAPVYGTAAIKAQLAPGSVASAQILDKGLTTFAPILVDQAPALPLRERIASLISVSWRQDRVDPGQARIAVATDVNKLVGGVRLVDAGSYLFTAREQKIPVTVVNDTNYDIKVVIQLTARTGQLTIGGPETVKVKANQSKLVRIATKALASGDAVVEGKLVRPDGVALAPAKNFTVRVRLNWESWGMISIGSILGLVLVLGLVRGLRRNRRRIPVPIEAVPDVDEAATRRAAGGSEPTGPTGSGPSVPAGSGPSGSGPSGSGPAEPGGDPGSSQGSDGRTLTASAAVAAGASAGAVVGHRRPPAIARFPGPEPDPEPVPDPVPVPVSMPDLEPDPKAMGGPVTPDGVRPPPRTTTRTAPAARPG